MRWGFNMHTARGQVSRRTDTKSCTLIVRIKYNSSIKHKNQ